MAAALLWPGTTVVLAQQVDAQTLFDEALAVYSEGHSQPAAERLGRIVEADPAFITDRGSAAYWLASALAEQGDDRAPSVRIDGIAALFREGRLDPRLVDAAVDDLEMDSSVPMVLLDAYAQMIARAGPAADSLTRLHVAYAALLVGDDVRSQVITSRPSADVLPTLAPDAGKRLDSWWRSQDPLPATARNERLEDHLRRVAHARRAYGDESRPIRLDDRGLTYIRFGEPRFIRSVSFDDARFYREVFRFGVIVTPSDFPANEVWVYSHIDHSLYYIFAQDHRRRFRLSDASSLVPRRLQNASQPSERGMNAAVSSLAAMRHIYQQLSTVHPDFGSLYHRIDDYAMWQEERRMARLAGAPLEVGEVEYRVGAGGTSVPVYINRLRSVEPVNEFIHSTVTEARSADRQAHIRREANEPNEYWALHNALDLDDLPVSFRASRFLDSDGGTTFTIDWAPAPGALRLREERLAVLERHGYDRHTDLMLEAAVMVFDQDWSERHRFGDSLAVMVGDSPDGVLTPRTLTFQVLPSDRRLRLQLDRYAAIVRPGPPPLIARGPRVQLGTARLGDLDRLNPEPRRVEMSDIRPFFSPLEPVDLVAEPDPLAEASPFPHSFAPSKGSLVLYFEAYHLLFDADDRTHYAIEYQVEKREPGAGFQRLLGRSRRDVTAARTEHRGTSQRTEEIIILDPAEWTDRAEIRLTIRLTDLVANQTVERTLGFQP